MKLYINENNKVVTMHETTSDMKCFEEFENRKPYSFDGVKELENCIHPIHVLLNTSMIDEKWIYMNHIYLKMTVFVSFHLAFLMILKMSLIGINSMRLDKEYGIALIKMYSTSMESVRNKQYGSITLKIQWMK